MSQIKICDYCKQPKDKTLKQTIKAKKFDFCEECLEQLFSYLISPAAFRKSEPKISRSKQDDFIREKIPFEELNDRESKIKAIEDEKVEEPIQRERLINNNDKKTFATTKSGNCLHLNKGRVEGINSNQPYRKCSNCGEKIYLKSKEERKKDE